MSTTKTTINIKTESKEESRLSNGESFIQCNICFENATEPIITQCGKKNNKFIICIIFHIINYII